MCQPQTENDRDQAGDEQHGDRLPQEQRPQGGRRDGAEREEHRDLGRGGMTEGPEPHVVTDGAACADKKDGQPAREREVER